MESASVPLPGAGGQAAESHQHDHHGPPEANQSSRIDRQTLGILLFIISEVMLFGAFFASYFFLRVVVNPADWPPQPFELPVAVAGMNTAILISTFAGQQSRWLESDLVGRVRGITDKPVSHVEVGRAPAAVAAAVAEGGEH